MTTKTLVKGITIEKALKAVKTFTSKSHTRPALKTALVNSEYVIATDSHRLIRVKHNEEVQESYLNRYNENHAMGYEAANYPNIDRIIPAEYDAEKTFSINIQEWIEAHDKALQVVKKEENSVIVIRENKLFTRINGIEDFSSEFTINTRIQQIAYSCKYMLEALKALKKLKVKEINVYFYGKHRPVLLKNEEIEVLILPCRIY